MREFGTLVRPAGRGGPPGVARWGTDLEQPDPVGVGARPPSATSATCSAGTTPSSARSSMATGAVGRSATRPPTSRSRSPSPCRPTASTRRASAGAARTLWRRPTSATGSRRSVCDPRSVAACGCWRSTSSTSTATSTASGSASSSCGASAASGASPASRLSSGRWTATRHVPGRSFDPQPGGGAGRRVLAQHEPGDPGRQVQAKRTQVPPPRQNQRRPLASANRSPFMPVAGCVLAADGTSRSCATPPLATTPRPDGASPYTPLAPDSVCPAYP